jgi:hypothetical protein
MNMVLWICEMVRPGDEIVAVLDRSSNHEFLGDDGLRTADMRVNDDCEKAPVLRETTWKDHTGVEHVQQMGKKGLRTVLLERQRIVVVDGKDAYRRGDNGERVGSKLKGPELRALLDDEDDFKNEKPRIEMHFIARGHRIIWGVVCHAELMPSEQKWCISKRWIRSEITNRGGAPFEKMVFEKMNSVRSIMIQRFFRKCRDTMVIYREGKQHTELATLLKEKKSHRTGVSQKEIVNRSAPREAHAQ